MAIPKMQERTLTELSRIQVRYFLVDSKKKPYLQILVIRYSGVYPLGSGGNKDAQFMYAMAAAGVAAFEPRGVIHDFTELAYEWGDKIEMVFDVGARVGPSPVAVVVGPACEEAIRTLILGEKSSDPIDTVGNVFRDLPEAWEYVADRIE